MLLRLSSRGGDQGVERGALAGGIRQIKWACPPEAEMVSDVSVLFPETTRIDAGEVLIAAVGKCVVKQHQIAAEDALELRNVAAGVSVAGFAQHPVGIGEVLDHCQRNGGGGRLQSGIGSGMIQFDQTINIVANGPAKDLAYQYANFLLAPATQTLLMRNFFVSPVNKKVIVPDDLKADVPVSGDAMAHFLNWDWDFVNANADKLSERWAKTVV